MLLLTTVSSLNNKINHIRQCRAFQHSMSNCCVYVFSETWLSQKITDAAVEVEVMTLHRADATLTSKDRGGDLAIYINGLCCLNTEVVSKVCTSDTEELVARFCPFYLPQELLAIIIVAAYIPSLTCYTRPSARCRRHNQMLSSSQQVTTSTLSGMQTAFANICERMGCPPELSCSSEKLE